MTADQLKAYRKKLGLSQSGLGRLCHVAKQTVYQYERGLRKIPGTIEAMLPLVSRAQAAQYRTKQRGRRSRTLA